MSVTLYDIPSKDGTTWSLNPWKTRMILNYKGIPYKTEWVEYPDLNPILKSCGFQPHDSDMPGYYTDYTSPAVRFEDGECVMDSWKIAQEIERRYPSPPLHLDDPVVVSVRDHIGKLTKPLAAHFLPKVPRVLLSERSAEYFERTRKGWFNMPLSQFEKEQATEERWKEVEQPAKEIADLLKRQGGPMFLGKTISYADFIFVSFLNFFKAIDAEVYERFLALDSSFATVYEACKQWLV
ncbi:glutathione S-transferas-like protein [Lojkania enalia]|uniref:Glutathione S-transferas-like protein n=1 Tax=Lojkania enalia TaxID=147567 RepID=A0A9P4N043_9PLEO|nr:glutathione S-transferas-like protein [Didymosphaeria enalia]